VSSGRFVSQCQDILPKVITAALVAAIVSVTGDTTFANNSSDLNAAGIASLDQWIKDSEKVDVTSVEIVGHADSRGDADYNQGLSERRAESIKTYLVEQGANPAKLTTSGRGESDPVASNSTKEGRAQNRRVDIKIVGTQKSN
jgi:OOP family OmpA-OmpF porin